MNPANFVTNHPYQAIMYAILFTNVVATMPTPNGTGFRATTFYKWFFAFAHSLPNIPRLIITIFPQFAGAMGLINQAEVAETQSKAPKSEPPGTL